MRASPLRRIAVFLALGLAVTAVLLLERERGERRREGELAAIEPTIASDDLAERLERERPETWVRQFDPGASAGGCSLVLYERRLPMLIDMNGRILHRWPQVRAVGRARLDRAGRLAVIGADNLIKEYDWDGRLRWFFRLPTPEDLPHHDLIRLASGRYLVLVQDAGDLSDYLLEVDRRGRVVWEWRAADHAAAFPGWGAGTRSPTHLNSLHELPPNRWYDGGDTRFRPGNLLVSARNLNTVFVIDRRSGEVVWQLSDGLDFQHEATMVREEDLGAGLVLLFNNGRNDLFGYRRSRVQAFDPQAGTLAWEYSSPFFYSSVAGTAHKLPGRNVAVTSSHGGRAFEVTPDGRIVWEWTPPYLPMRVERLPLDHCPQLAALPPPQDVEVRLAGDSRPFIDIDLYSFALPEDYVVREVERAERRLFRGNAGCRELFLPPGAQLWAEWGLDAQRLAGRPINARFRATLRVGDGEERALLDETMTEASQPPWRGRFVPLDAPGYRWATLCVSAEAEGEMEKPLELAAWGNPFVTSPAQRKALAVGEWAAGNRERELRERQLRALGYVN